MAKVAGPERHDLIDIYVPKSLHREIAVAALNAGKMVATEKPLALNLDQGKEMVDAAAVSGKKWFGLTSAVSHLSRLRNK